MLLLDRQQIIFTLYWAISQEYNLQKLFLFLILLIEELGLFQHTPIWRERFESYFDLLWIIALLTQAFYWSEKTWFLSFWFNLYGKLEKHLLEHFQHQATPQKLISKTSYTPSVSIYFSTETSSQMDKSRKSQWWVWWMKLLFQATRCNCHWYRQYRCWLKKISSFYEESIIFAQASIRLCLCWLSIWRWIWNHH
jgi:hypothetical protein